MPRARTPSSAGMVETGGSRWRWPTGGSITAGGLGRTAQSYRWCLGKYRPLSERRTWRASASGVAP